MRAVSRGPTRLVVALCAVFVVLNAADLFTALVGVDRGRHASVLAPIMTAARALGSGSLLPAIGIKVADAVIVCGIVRLGWLLTDSADASDTVQARIVLTCFVGVACAITLVVVVLNLVTVLT
jgi:hypothetical protein